MNSRQGIIAIIGSGETGESMIRVHRFLLQSISPPLKAAFLDTPAGFQLNADELYEKAKDYFARHLGQNLEQISFKSSKNISPSAAEKAWQNLREANYIFVGPGSPTYALKNWLATPLPEILYERIKAGACLVAASAAALTLGRYTLPVYEIYKVGEDLHWVEGMNLLGKFGLDLVVIPHWNNAEGGTHDTRFCYMGEPRLNMLEALLPKRTPILGIDEHTACIINFYQKEISIRGLGGITFRHQGKQKFFATGQNISFPELAEILPPPSAEEAYPSSSVDMGQNISPFWDQVNSLKNSFVRHLEEKNGATMADILVHLDKLILDNSQNIREEENFRAHQTLWQLISQLGLFLDGQPKDIMKYITPLVNLLLDIRQHLRQEKWWSLADEIRIRMAQVGIIVEDTPTGPRWRFKEK
ncbi:MAG: hypothetical protein ACUVWV_14140 [Thermodesulfobacteriota bacterium]